MLTLTKTQTDSKHFGLLTVAGKIDAKTMLEFEQGIRVYLQDGVYRLILDFSEVNFISSAGLGILMSVLDEFQGQGGDLVLAQVQSEVYRVFDLLDFTTVFNFYPDVNAAIKDFS
jgi:anti-sigma B factor antagonist